MTISERKSQYEAQFNAASDKVTQITEAIKRLQDELQTVIIVREQARGMYSAMVDVEKDEQRAVEETAA